MSRGNDHLSMWSAGCFVEKQCPLESQKPTSKPWPIRLLVLLGIVLLVVGDVRLDGLLLLYECSTTSTRRIASAAAQLCRAECELLLMGS